jgi:hypothetical protein
MTDAALSPPAKCKRYSLCKFETSGQVQPAPPHLGKLSPDHLIGGLLRSAPAFLSKPIAFPDFIVYLGTMAHAFTVWRAIQTGV